MTSHLALAASLTATAYPPAHLQRASPKRIFIGLIAGIACGRFGELVASLKVVADGFVKLLPYASARRLGLRVRAVTGGLCAIAGAVRFQPARLLRRGINLVLLRVGTIGGLRVLFISVLSPHFDGARIIYGMKPLHTHEESVTLTGEAAAHPPPTESNRVVASILVRGVLRDGFFLNRMPRTFTDSEGILAGFAVESTHNLAQTPGVRAKSIELRTSELRAATLT